MPRDDVGPSPPIGRLRRQAGFTLAQAVIVLSVFAAVWFAAYLAKESEKKRGYATDTSELEEKVRDALIAYVAVNRRLPCPAAYGTSDAAPLAANTACTSPSGGVPWRTLGLREREAQDVWGHYFAYRVYSGATGLTRAGGLDMSQCAIAGVPTGVPTTDCGAGTAPADFLLNKGLSVRDAPAGTLLNDPASGTGAAFLLISYGADGRGARLPSGGTLTAPLASNNEFPNADNAVAGNGTLSSGSAYIYATPAKDVTNPDADGNFDDAILRLTIRELADAAGLDAR